MKAWTQLLEPGPALASICFTLVLIATNNVNAAPGISEETTEIEYYPVADATGCYYNFQHYDEGDRIITNEPCLNCTCHNKMLMCYLKVCPFTKAIGADCKVEKRHDQCCPVITCPEVPVQLVTSTVSSTDLGHPNEYGCSIDGLFYSDGARVPSNPNNPCELCYCIRNKTACVIQECTLKVDGCYPVYQEGVCCPIRYNCEHPLYLEGSTTPLLTTTTTTTTTTTLAPTTTMLPQGCVYNGEIYADGALIKKDIPCEKCYCMKGDVVCAVQECGPTPLDKVNCKPLPAKEGQCCSESYDCSGISEEEMTTLSAFDATTTAVPFIDISIDTRKQTEPVADFTAMPEQEPTTQENIEEITKETETKSPQQPSDDTKPTAVSSSTEPSTTEEFPKEQKPTETIQTVETEQPPKEEQPVKKEEDQVKEGEEEATEASLETTTAGILDSIFTGISQTIETITDFTTGKPSEDKESVLTEVRKGEEQEQEQATTELPEFPTHKTQKIPEQEQTTESQKEEAKSSTETVPLQPTQPEEILEEATTALPEKVATETERQPESPEANVTPEIKSKQTDKPVSVEETESTTVPDKETSEEATTEKLPKMPDFPWISKTPETKTAQPITVVQTESTTVPDEKTSEEATTEKLPKMPDFPWISKTTETTTAQPITVFQAESTTVPHEKTSEEATTKKLPEMPDLPWISKTTEGIPTKSSQSQEPEMPPVTEKEIVSEVRPSIDEPKETEQPQGVTKQPEQKPEVAEEPTTPEVIIVTQMPKKTELPEAMDHISEKHPQDEEHKPTEEIQTFEQTEAPSGTEKTEEDLSERKYEVTPTEETTEIITESKMPTFTESVPSKSDETEKPETDAETQAPEQSTEESQQPSKTEEKVQEVPAITTGQPKVEESTTIEPKISSEFSVPPEEPTTQIEHETPTEKSILSSTEEPRQEENEIETHETEITSPKSKPRPEVVPEQSIATESTDEQKESTATEAISEQTTFTQSQPGVPETEKPIVPEVCTSETECAPVLPSVEENTPKVPEPEKPIESETALPEGATETNKIPESGTEKEGESTESNAIPDASEGSATLPIEKEVESHTKDSSGEVSSTEKSHTEEEGSGGAPTEASGAGESTEGSGLPIATDLPSVVMERQTEEPVSLVTEQHRGTSTTDIPPREIPGEGSCLHNGKTYENNSEVPPINRCHTFCKCVNSELKCETDCPAPPAGGKRCTPIFASPESCCPEYSCVETTTILEQPEVETTARSAEPTQPEVSTEKQEPSAVTTEIQQPESTAPQEDLQPPKTSEESVTAASEQQQPTEGGERGSQPAVSVTERIGPDVATEVSESETKQPEVEITEPSKIYLPVTEKAKESSHESTKLPEVSSEPSTAEKTEPLVTEQPTGETQTEGVTEITAQYPETTIGPKLQSVEPSQQLPDNTEYPATQTETLLNVENKPTEGEFPATTPQLVVRIPAQEGTTTQPQVPTEISGTISEQTEKSITKQPELPGIPGEGLEPIESQGTDTTQQPEFSTPSSTVSTETLKVPGAEGKPETTEEPITEGVVAITEVVAEKDASLPEKSTESDVQIEKETKKPEIIKEGGELPKKEGTEVPKEGTESPEDSSLIYRKEQPEEANVVTEHEILETTTPLVQEKIPEEEIHTTPKSEEKKTKPTLEKDSRQPEFEQQKPTEPSPKELEQTTPTKEEKVTITPIYVDETKRPAEEQTTPSGDKAITDQEMHTVEPSGEEQTKRPIESDSHVTITVSEEKSTEIPEQATKKEQESITKRPETPPGTEKPSEYLTEKSTKQESITKQPQSQPGTTTPPEHSEGTETPEKEFTKPTDELPKESETSEQPSGTEAPSKYVPTEAITTKQPYLGPETSSQEPGVQGAIEPETKLPPVQEETSEESTESHESITPIITKIASEGPETEQPFTEKSTKQPGQLPAESTEQTIKETPRESSTKVPTAGATEEATELQTTEAVPSKDFQETTKVSETSSAQPEIALAETTEKPLEEQTTKELTEEVQPTQKATEESTKEESPFVTEHEKEAEKTTSASEEEKPETTAPSISKKTDTPKSEEEQTEMPKEKLSTTTSEEGHILPEQSVTTTQPERPTEKPISPETELPIDRAKPAEEEPTFTSPPEVLPATTQSSERVNISLPDRIGEGLEPYTLGPLEITTKQAIEGELSTSVPISSESSTTILPPATTSSYPGYAHIPGEPEVPGMYPTGEGDEYEEEDSSQAFGPGTCRYGGKVYVSAQQIPRDDPCDFCFCFRSDIICLQQSCPPPIPRCHEEPIRGFCCPRYECPVSMATSLNLTTSTTTTTTTLPPHFFSHAYKGRATKTGCQIQGKAYKIGEVIRSTSGPCLHCTCGGDGQMKCDPKACSPEPMLRQMIAAAASKRRR